jgi:hypothetical protein
MLVVMLLTVMVMVVPVLLAGAVAALVAVGALTGGRGVAES